ncbi:hypothetical protein OG689_00335 [Kitasatospora sp. NBC_00240]|uniref:hypothetical protein n=1 Tax=Kitasatospora sp. NBC_00240 TaxID=2903567 RepID=UPI00225025B4|nr:hypothetical protein [Kitasatospora sp. NBC_00240]MCX5207780.1 hypothetical protein [Kitasatospora sp. NBC_00240]
MSMLILKLLLAPALVVASSLAGRRWGPTLAGTLVALPIVAGPILFITWLEHGRRFAARAAGASLLGLISLALFAVVFALLARTVRTGHWAVTLVLAWAVCLAADLALCRLSVAPAVALCLSLAATAGGAKALGRARADGVPKAPSPPRWDLPARAAATALLVTALTTAASHLGPDLTGVLAPFPIGTSVVATFALAQGGPAVAEATLRGVLRGLVGFAAFCYLVAVLTEPLDGAAAFGIAVVCTLALQLGVGRLQGALAARRAARVTCPDRAGT